MPEECWGWSNFLQNHGPSATRGCASIESTKGSWRAGRTAAGAGGRDGVVLKGTELSNQTAKETAGAAMFLMGDR